MQKLNGAYEAIDTGVARALNDFQKHYLAGHQIAAIDAVRFCRQHQLALPSWLGEVVTDNLTSYLAGKKAPGKGRSASPLARYLANYKDYCRWTTVQNVLSADAPKRKPSIGRSTPAACEPSLNYGFEQARLELRGGIAEGSLGTMERAYWKVERMRRKGIPIYFARRDTLADLGVEMPEECSESPQHG
jgi:hypothetical protein